MRWLLLWSQRRAFLVSGAILAACGGRGADVVIGDQPPPPAEAGLGESGAPGLDATMSADASSGGDVGRPEASVDATLVDVATDHDGGETGVDAADAGDAADASDANDANVCAFDAGSLSGLVLWLDAARGVTASGTGVSSWADQTGYHNDAAQTVPSLQPTLVTSAIHGLPAIHFNKDAGGASPTTGAGQMVAIADSPSMRWGTGDFFVAMVADFDNALDGGAERVTGALFSKVPGGVNTSGVELTANVIGAIDLANQLGLSFTTNALNGDWVATHTGYNDGKPRVFAVARSAGTLDLRVDGVSVGTDPSTNDDVDAIDAAATIGSTVGGRGLRLDGDVAEVLALRGTLGPCDRAAIEAYLMGKYGL